MPLGRVASGMVSVRTVITEQLSEIRLCKPRGDDIGVGRGHDACGRVARKASRKSSSNGESLANRKYKASTASNDCRGNT